jgi:hypothetical protein
VSKGGWGEEGGKTYLRLPTELRALHPSLTNGLSGKKQTYFLGVATPCQSALH